MEPRTARGLAAAVQPTFMLPAVATAVAGGLLAPAVAVPTLAAHAGAVAVALYTAHLVDEYVDAHVRGEEAATVPERATRYAVAASTAVFVALLAVLWLRDARAAVAATVPLWLLAVLHAPVLDTHPVSVTVDYPAGVALAAVGGYLAQTGRASPAVLAFAGSLAVLLSGLDVSVDRLDREFDATIEKRTVPVVLGDRRGGQVAAALHALAAVVVGVLALTLALPVTAIAATPFPLAGAAVGLVASRERAVRAQMALAYPFAAVLWGAQCAAAGCAVARWASAAGLA